MQTLQNYELSIQEKIWSVLMYEVVSGWTGKWMDRWMSFESIAFISAIVYSLKNYVFNFQLLNSI